MTFSTMVDMRRTAEDKVAAAARNTYPAPLSETADYPPELCICFDEEILDKLDLDGDCEVGDIIDLRAFARVTSVSSREVDGRQCRRIELQITDLAVENENEEET